MATDLSDVLIAFSKRRMFWIVVLFVAVAVVGYVDHKNGSVILSGAGIFFQAIAEILLGALGAVT